MLFKLLRELFFITGICILLQPNTRCTMRVVSDDGCIGFNHEYPAYCSVNTNHPLARLSGACESSETED